jgi:hypothetical protein
MNREITLNGKKLFITEKENARGKIRDFVYVEFADGEITEVSRCNPGAWIETITGTQPNGKTFIDPVVKFHGEDGIESVNFHNLFV